MKQVLRRALFTTAVCFLFSCGIRAQLLDWLGFANHPGNSNVLVKDIGGDQTGNTYFLIQFTGTVTIESFTYTSPLDIDFLIVKRDLNENLVWIRRIYGSGAFNCRSICADSAGSVYVVGSYYPYDTVSFDSSSTSIISLPVYTEPAGYIGKYDANGFFQWGKTIEGQYTPSFSIQIDLNFVRLNGTSIFVTSLIYGAFDYDPSGSTQMVGGGNMPRSIVASYDLNGNMEWAEQLGSFGSYVNYLCFAPEKKILIAGNLTGSSVDLDPGPANTSFSAVGPSDIFVTCLDSLGTYQWTRSITGNNTQEIGGITMLSDSHFVVCGITNATIDLDPSSGVCSIPVSSGEKDFLSIYNMMSTFYSGGEVNTGATPEQIFCNGYDEIVIYGAATSGHYALIFADTGFNVLSFNSYGGNSPGCSASCTYFRDPFTLFIGGHCGGSNFYGNDGVMNVYASNASYTGFAVKYYLNWGPQESGDPLSVEQAVKIYPNPASDKIYVDLKYGQITSRITVYNTSGQQVISDNVEQNGAPLICVDVSRLPQGWYSLALETESGQLKVPLVITR